MKALIFDTDRSLSTIGSYDQIEKLLGVRPVQVNNGPLQLMELLNSLFVVKRKMIKHEVFDTEVEEYHLELNEKALKLDLGCVVLDTGSTLATQGRQQIVKRSSNDFMAENNWGEHLSEQINLYMTLCRANVPLIVNMHIEDKKDVWFPDVKGGARTQVANYFDVVLFTSVQDGAYMWHPRPRKGKIAGDRRDLLGTDPIPQDYGLILKPYAEAGLTTPKILVLGHSKTGKTYALKTLANVNL